ncbi:C39 family peptidase [Mediterraneibacter glycyrrhizinilyticus]|uniref:C39 family peptidase n=1 Tax=Mediterraneibacter glycyrrhizinilyticus TaxID=342942 RepID=UPI0019621BE9|nr:C39 family peptidase [Mediterraneibacter glycyrrhizinilyticus]MBM6751381.1 C39 family peptidase [Mediterraneibacter glycyrrhizinilyticus]
MTEQVRPLEITTEEPDVEEVPGQNEADPSAEESVDGEAGVSGEEKTVEESTASEIENFPVINQMPELPTGCEITALTMVLQYYGYPADKTDMASGYLPTASADRYYGDDGRLYGTDMNEYFIGDPFTAGGIICGTGAIVTAADRYLDDQGSSMRALDMTGSSPEELYKLVSRGQPVIVWVTISMADRGSTQGWYTEDGEYVDWSTNDHGAVLIGYTETTVTIADPISGRIEYDREQFEKVFESRKNQCVVLE